VADQFDPMCPLLAEAVDLAAKNLRVLAGDVNARHVGVQFTLPHDEDAVVDLAIRPDRRPVIGLDHHERDGRFHQFEIRRQDAEHVIRVRFEFDDDALGVAVIPRGLQRQRVVHRHEWTPLLGGQLSEIGHGRESPWKKVSA
jgi:hypothetical protein